MAAKQTTDYSQIPSYQEAAEAANLTPEVGLSDLLDEPIIVKEWTPDSKIVPQTGKRTQGFTMRGTVIKTEEDFEVFVGAVKLINELTALAPPFRTVIRLSGQTYRFS